MCERDQLGYTLIRQRQRHALVDVIRVPGCGRRAGSQHVAPEGERKGRSVASPQPSEVDGRELADEPRGAQN